MILAAVDPGARKCGVAVFNDRRLIAASTVLSNEPAMAKTVAGYIRKYGEPVQLIAEDPQHYRLARVKHKDLDRLKAVLVELDNLVGPLVLIPPHAWKANVPKNIHHARVMRALRPSELELWTPLGHDGRDAVALGLFALARTFRGGTPMPSTCPRSS